MKEALTLALEWIEDAVVVLSHTSSAIQGGIGAEAEGVGGCSVKVVTAIRVALAQPEQEPEFAYVMEAGEDRWKKLLIQERNFCQRCGKRLADLTAIHTCTPPAQA